MAKRILLTGATGFVGRHVLRELTKSGAQVTAVVRNQKKALSASEFQAQKVVESLDLFVEPTEWWVDVCQKIDIVVHLAWYAEPGKYLHSPLNIDCLAGTLNLARGAVQAGIQRFVGVGTCFEYDLAPGMLTINTPLKPVTLYAASKAGAYIALSQYFPAQGVEFAWCRLFYLYGEGEDERRLVPYIRKQLAACEEAKLTNGAQIRDYIDVSDAGRMIADVALGNHSGPVNICSGVPVTVRQLAEKIADEYGQRDLLRFGAREDNLLDPPCIVGFPGGKA